jgi:type II secretory pathway pseudopilin PulG
VNRRGGIKSRGFTIVELLIVIAIIIMLMGILIVAINAATRTAQGANTRSLMASLKQGLARFRGDFGYLPPVLGDPSPTVLTAEDHDLRKLFDPRGSDLQWDAGSGDDILPEGPDETLNGDYAANVQEWYSVTTLTDYLLGYGHHYQDGYGYVPPDPGPESWLDEKPPLGIRTPGQDGVWGATVYGAADGALADRMQGASDNLDIGQVYGPYVDLKDERMLASVKAVEGTEPLYDAQGYLKVVFPGENGYDADNPKVFVDYWGNPIRYYRRLYAPGDLRSPYRRLDRTRPEPTLSDVFLLRPFRVDPGNAIDAPFADAGGDTTTTAALNSAEFALFSAGPDRFFNPDLRYDDPDDPGNTRGTDLFNEDNIVELGP